MGRPKQLLPYRGSTLIAHAVSQAVQALDSVIVVVGAYSSEVRATVGGLQVAIVENPSWETGLSSSIAAGIDHLSNCKNVDGALLMAGDQPFVTAAHLQAIVAAFSITGTGPGPDIVAAEYGGTLGVPALFTHRLFPRLLALNGDKGARILIQDPALRVMPFPLPEAAIDIDTPDDAATLY